MSNFWVGFIIGGFICGIIGFLGAAILAASGRASRVEEKMSDTMFKTVKRGKSNFSKMAHEVEVVKQNDPRTD